MTEPVTVAFRTLGCKVNRVESEDIAADLLGRGALLADVDEAAVIVVNTCTVTGEADAKARKAVRQALSAKMNPLVVVTGCLAAIDADMLEALDSRVIVESDKSRVAERVAAALDLDAVGIPVPRAGEGFRTRALLKVEEGCDVFCSYCIVPYARGVPRSTPLADVIAQVERLVQEGTNELVLTGINLGRYRDAGCDLAGLIRAVAAAGPRRIRLSSIEPVDLTDDFLEAVSRVEQLCPHLHVPLQSGSDAVLAAMRRPYTLTWYEERLRAARAAIPGLAVTTDVIAGFPGETDEQAAQTASACERIGFSKLHVFRYSPRRGTPAADMPGQVPPQVKAARAEALRDLGDRLRAEHAGSRVGTIAEVLVETVSDGVAQGTTEDYLPAALAAAGGVTAGDIVTVTVDGFSGTSLSVTLL